MSIFDKRDKGFENKFVHDEELAFKSINRRNKLLGLWAAAKLGKTGTEATEYAKEVVLSDFETSGSDDVIAKLLKDFESARLSINAKEIEAEMERLLPIARQEVMGEKN